MFTDTSLSFREYIEHNPLPLYRLHGAIFDFLRQRSDVALSGIQAVNAYVKNQQTVADFEMISSRAHVVALELAASFHHALGLEVFVRRSSSGLKFRLEHVALGPMRVIAVLSQRDSLPPTNRIDGILVPCVEDLIATCVISHASRTMSYRGGLDLWAVMSLLLAHPHLKSESSLVADRLRVNEADDKAFSQWREFVEKELESENDEDEFM